jgi:hypothetical protein
MNLPDTHKMQCALKCNWKKGNARFDRVRVDIYKEVNLIRNENMKGKKDKRNVQITKR